MAVENSQKHIPVLSDEVIEYLSPEKNDVILDCTLGLAGHALRILDYLEGDCQYIGIDQDASVFEIATANLKNYKKSFHPYRSNFRNLDVVLSELNVKKVDRVLFDLGVSSFQIDDPSRGFSFVREGLLDMRMDASGELKALDVVNRFSLEELDNIISDYGEERYSRKIAALIVDRRRLRLYKTTLDLAKDIESVCGHKYERRIHPATRTFQALRIFVNDELNALKEALGKVISFLNLNGRVVVISFHSLEDRIVKNFFRDLSRQGVVKLLCKKPVVPARGEIVSNPRSRSAKLRAVVKI